MHTLKKLAAIAVLASCIFAQPSSAQKESAQAERASAAFDKLDRDKDSKLSKAEFKELMTKAPQDKSEAAFAKMAKGEPSISKGAFVSADICLMDPRPEPPLCPAAN